MASFANNTVIIICHSLISVTVINTLTKTNLGIRGGFISPYMPCLQLPLKEVKAGTQAETGT